MEAMRRNVKLPLVGEWQSIPAKSSAPASQNSDSSFAICWVNKAQKRLDSPPGDEYHNPQTVAENPSYVNSWAVRWRQTQRLFVPQLTPSKPALDLPKASESAMHGIVYYPQFAEAERIKPKKEADRLLNYRSQYRVGSDQRVGRN